MTTCVFLVWQTYFIFFIYANKIWKLYTYVYQYTTLMPIKCSVTVTIFFIWQPICVFTPILMYSLFERYIATDYILYACIYVYMYVCMYACMKVYMCVCACIYTSYIHRFMYVGTYMSMYVCRGVIYMYTCKYVCLYTYIYTYV